jgi:hypothetical protein
MIELIYKWAFVGPFYKYITHSNVRTWNRQHVHQQSDRRVRNRELCFKSATLNFSYSFYLKSWSSVLREKLTVAQANKKVHAFCRTRSFTAAFTVSDA